SSALSTSGAITSLPITPLEGAIASGNSITVSNGSHTQTFTASAAAAGGATSVTVTSATPNFAYPLGSSVVNSAGNTAAGNTNCYDVKTTSPGTTGATKGTDLNFNATTNNPFCGTTLIYVQETTGGLNYCWVGNGAGAASGLCNAPISVNLSSALTTAAP